MRKKLVSLQITKFVKHALACVPQELGHKANADGWCSNLTRQPPIWVVTVSKVDDYQLPLGTSCVHQYTLNGCNT